MGYIAKNEIHTTYKQRLSNALQTILPPLAMVEGDSTVLLRGGTHVPWSPSMTYIERVYLPMLERMGIDAGVELRAWGWYPRGNGEAELRVRGRSSRPRGLQLLERGAFRGVRGLSIVTELPESIARRMAGRAMDVLRESGIDAKVRSDKASSIGPGAAIFLGAEYGESVAGFSALGKLGLPAERVAEIACEDFLSFHATDAPIDRHLADQILLPLALASGSSRYRVETITSHLTTNARVIESFEIATVAIEPGDRIVTVTPAR
ncbi:RNA 3'-terminal phosphate cyclase [Pannus brasiliensis CCIBt3594]|uniref:RNA 3'-terminal-phosphate cyclase (ATP) n=1 Tax=Pannus brasiliensis CCIBt3594 TaxID=1427578 RepID=A0AAW9QNT8_9CHRO